MKTLLVLFLILEFSVAQAQVVVRHPDTDEVSYLQSVTPGSQTVVDHLQAGLPSSDDEQRLLAKFEKAQTLFLSSDLTQAKVAFIEVTEEALRADWNEIQRKVIAISFFRSAQLSEDTQVVQTYLVRAAQFASDLAIDSSLFPPPLVVQYKEALAREKSRSVQIDLKDKFPQHDLVIIDGRRVPSENMHSFNVMPGQHRVTALSNSHQAFSQQLSTSQLALIKADVPPYAIGTCDDPALSGYQSLNSEEVKIVFAKNCIRTYTGTTWVQDSPQTGKLPSDLTQIYPHNFATSSAPQPILNKKKLVLIGLGVGVLVTSIMLINKSHQTKEEVVPVSRQGF